MSSATERTAPSADADGAALGGEEPPPEDAQAAKRQRCSALSAEACSTFASARVEVNTRGELARLIQTGLLEPGPAALEIWFPKGTLVGKATVTAEGEIWLGDEQKNSLTDLVKSLTGKTQINGREYTMHRGQTLKQLFLRLERDAAQAGGAGAAGASGSTFGVGDGSPLAAPTGASPIDGASPAISKQLVNDNDEDAGIELTALSLLAPDSAVQRVMRNFHAAEQDRLRVDDLMRLQTTALTEIISADDQANRVELIRFCFEGIGLWPTGRPLDKKAPPLHATINAEKMSNNEKVRRRHRLPQHLRAPHQPCSS